jgi:two-component system, sensor histidine kinase and response regulator
VSEQGRILVVDDHRTNRLKLVLGLSRQGHSVEESANGRDALARLREKPFDLILLDILMPEMDGYEVLTELKRDAELQKIPVIVISAQDELQSVVRCIELGAEDYLPKSFDPVLLRARINACLEKKRLRDHEQREKIEKDNLLRDISLKKELLEKTYEEKRTLLSIVTHDIANAVFAIQSSVMLEARNSDNDFSRLGKNFARISRAAEAMHEIINTVRELEAIESGKAKMQLSQVCLDDLFTKMRQLFSETLQTKKLALTIETQAPAPLFVVAEPLTLGNHVLSNLLSNAIKFSFPDSAIRISVMSRGDEVALTITDSGIGIPPDLVANLFRFDVKTTRPGTLQEKGTGFGMPVVKKFVEYYGGRIEIESRTIEEFPNDHGTSITIILRAHLPESA